MLTGQFDQDTITAMMKDTPHRNLNHELIDLIGKLGKAIAAKAGAETKDPDANLRIIGELETGINKILADMQNFCPGVLDTIKKIESAEIRAQLLAAIKDSRPLLDFSINAVDLRKDSESFGMTPVSFAARYGLHNLVHRLVMRGAYLDAANQQHPAKLTALTYAIRYGHTDTVKSLIPLFRILFSQRSFPKEYNDYKHSPFHAIFRDESDQPKTEEQVLSFLKILCEGETESKQQNSLPIFSPLLLSFAVAEAVIFSMPKVIEYLFTLQTGVYPFSLKDFDTKGLQPNIILQAVFQGDEKVLAMLLSKRHLLSPMIDLDDFDSRALMIALDSANHPVLKLLLSHGASITVSVVDKIKEQVLEMKEPEKTNFIQTIFDNVPSTKKAAVQKYISRELSKLFKEEKPDPRMAEFLIKAGADVNDITAPELLKKFSHLLEDSTKKGLILAFIKAGLKIEDKFLSELTVIFNEESEFLNCLKNIIEFEKKKYLHSMYFSKLLIEAMKIAFKKNWLKVMDYCHQEMHTHDRIGILENVLKSEFLTVEKLKIFRNEYLAVPNPIQVVLENEKLKPQPELVREIIKELIANKVPVPHQIFSNGISHPTLNVLVERADPLLFDLFLEQKLPVNECNSDEDERTPLLTAMMMPEINIEIVQQLLKHGAIADKMDNDANHPLAFALYSLNKEAIDLLKPKTDLRFFVRESNFSIKDLFASERVAKSFYGFYVSVIDLIPYIDFSFDGLLTSLLVRIALANDEARSVDCAHSMCMTVVKHHAKSLSFVTLQDVFNYYTSGGNGFTKEHFEELLTTIHSHDLLQKLQVTVHNKEKNDMCTQRLALLNKRKDSEIKRLQHVIQSEIKMQLVSEHSASMKPDVLMLPKNIPSSSEKSWSMLALTYNQTISLMEDKTKKPTLVNFSQNIVDKVKEIKPEELIQWPLEVVKPLLLFVLKVDLKYQTKHFSNLKQKLISVDVSKECLRWIDACKPSDIAWDKDYLNDICKYLIERQHQGKDLELLIRLWNTLAASKKLDEQQLYGLTQKFINSLMDLNVDVFKQWSSPALAKLLNWTHRIETRYKTTGCTIKLFEKIQQAGCWDCLLYPPEEKAKPLIHSWVRSNDPQVFACMKMSKENFRTARYTVFTAMGMHKYKHDDLELGENNLCDLLDLYFACEKFTFEARQSQQKDKLKLIAQFKVFIFKICAFYSDNDKTKDTGFRSHANDTWQIDLDYELNLMLGMAKNNPVLFNLLERFKKEHHSVELLIAHDKSSSMPKTQEQVAVANGSEIKDTPKIIETSDKESAGKEVKAELPHQELTTSDLQKLKKIEFLRVENFLLKRHQTDITDILNGMKKVESELSSGLIAPPNSPVKGAAYLAPTSMSSAAMNSHRSGVTAPPNSPANIQDTSFSPKLTP